MTAKIINLKVEKEKRYQSLGSKDAIDFYNGMNLSIFSKVTLRDPIPDGAVSLNGNIFNAQFHSSEWDDSGTQTFTYLLMPYSEYGRIYSYD